MPSLWDMHVHFGGDTLIGENKLLLPLYTVMGISHVRDCAGDISDSVIAWKNAIAENKLEGPSIFTSGPKLEGIKSIWPGDLEIGNENELEIALDSLQKLKVDFVKITDNTLEPSLFLKSIREGKFTYDEIFDMVDEFERKFQHASKNSELPSNPNYKRVEELVMSIYEKRFKL